MDETDENWVWDVDMEVNLFHAMRGHKPVGVNRYFQMVSIHEKLSQSSARKFTTKQIWKHLNTMYDLQALNESEILQFPNKEEDFQLSEEEYAVWINKTFPRIPHDILAESEAKKEEREAVNKAKEKEMKEKEKQAKEKEKEAKEKERMAKEKEREAKEKEAKEKEAKEKEREAKEKESKEKEIKEKEKESKEKETKDKDSKEKEAKKADKKTINKIMIDLCSANTSENSPKRKRTRNTSHSASPATDTPPTKRRR